jgi:hypothetical protein
MSALGGKRTLENDGGIQTDPARILTGLTAAALRLVPRNRWRNLGSMLRAQWGKTANEWLPYLKKQKDRLKSRR